MLMPLGWNANGTIREVRDRSWVQSPRQPIPKEDGPEGDPLPARATEGQQKSECITQTDLGQCVFKGEVGRWAAGGAEKNSECDKEEAAPQSMAKHVLKSLAFAPAAPQRIGQGNAYEESERRLDHVVETHAGPLNVRLIVGQDAPETTSGG